MYDRDAYMTQLQETGWVHVRGGATLAELNEMCKDLGLNSNEMHLCYNKNAVLLTLSAAPKK